LENKWEWVTSIYPLFRPALFAWFLAVCIGFGFIPVFRTGKNSNSIKFKLDKSDIPKFMLKLDFDKEIEKKCARIQKSNKNK